MPRDTIPLRTTYAVPMIWLDRAHGRERLACVHAEATFQLRQVAPDDLRPVVDGSAIDDDLLSDIPFEGPPKVGSLDEMEFEGRSWRPLGSSRPDGGSLEGIRQMMWNDGLAACSWLSLDLPTKLTTKPALRAFEDAGLPDRILACTVERLDAEALERARLAVERDFLWDGGILHYATGYSLGMPDDLATLDRKVLDCIGRDAILLLEHTADFAARDPEGGRLSAEVRRIAIRGLVNAIPLDDIEPAVRKVGRLAELASRRLPGRSTRNLCSRILAAIEGEIIPALAKPPREEDEATLSTLAP